MKKKLFIKLGPLVTTIPMVATMISCGGASDSDSIHNEQIRYKLKKAKPEMNLSSSTNPVELYDSLNIIKDTISREFVWNIFDYIPVNVQGRKYIFYDKKPQTAAMAAFKEIIKNLSPASDKFATNNAEWIKEKSE